jgi:hypothetical protein
VKRGIEREWERRGGVYKKASRSLGTTTGENSLVWLQVLCGCGK